MSSEHSTRCHSEIHPGDRFDRWTVIALAEKSHSKTRWLCRCSCGSEKTVYERYLQDGLSRSCGCLRSELLTAKNTVHGHSQRGKRSAEYNSWINMRSRCYDPINKEWANYGGRGITICERWRESFEIFLADMGTKPSRRHQIDRIDNNGHYEPDNCRWATPMQNAQNTRRNIFLEHNGKRLTQSEWARVVGLSPATICERRAAGWTVAEILTTPAIPGKKHR